jgi:hypothetical protein
VDRAVSRRCTALFTLAAVLTAVVAIPAAVVILGPVVR